MSDDDDDDVSVGPWVQVKVVVVVKFVRWWTPMDAPRMRHPVVGLL